MTVQRKATATSCANIALVKYWGKRDATLNLPAKGSLSLTLAELTTTTTFEVGDFAAHELVLNGEVQSGKSLEAFTTWLQCLSEFCAARGRDEMVRLKARAVSSNSFPTASGLASSASAYSALSAAANHALSLDLSPREQSVLARRGSGSAARSMFGGWVRMHQGQSADGLDSFAEPLPGPVDWASMVICVVAGGKPKHLPSRSAMDLCAKTSPLYQGWLGSVDTDLAEAESAILAGDLPKLGEITERSALTMHACAMASRPPVLYWKPETLALLAAVWDLRRDGILAFATMDAGPHVKVLCQSHDAQKIATALQNVPGVDRTIVSAAGSAPKVERAT